MNMIGNKENLNEIKELLHKIAKQNKEKYGHILDNTDCGATEIVLGFYKKDFDEEAKHRIKFNIISGYFIDTDNYSSYNTFWGNYFELSDTFEQDMEEKLQKLKEKEIMSKKNGEETIKRLKRLVSK